MNLALGGASQSVIPYVDPARGGVVQQVDVLSKEQLVEAAWGKEFVGETSSITVFIKKLREKVEDDPSDPRVIQTVWGIGYRFEPEGREG